VIASGVRGSAWNSVMKDLLILAIVLFLGIYLPIRHYGGIGEMFHAIDAARPGFLTFPEKGSSVVWFQSTVLLTALGFFMWPHTFGSVFTAKSERIFRRNAMVLPIYQLILLFVFFVGFAASLKVPGLKGGDIDLSLFRLSIQSFDPWFVGVIGAAGVLTALVPGSMILTTASTLLANDIYRGALARQAPDAAVAKLARCLVPVVALVAVLFTLNSGETIVALLLGYNFVTQLFPALVCSLAARNRVTKQGAFCGIAVGVLVVTATSLMHLSVGQLLPFLPDTLKDVNIGFVALTLNVIVLAIVSAVTQTQMHAQQSGARTR
jgi:SSS family solute:Na+ symporter